jgi:hypothetical protein
MAFTFAASIAAPAGSDFCLSHDKFYSGLSMPTVDEDEVLFVNDGLQYIVGGELVEEGEVVLGAGSEIVAV